LSYIPIRAPATPTTQTTRFTPQPHQTTTPAQHKTTRTTHTRLSAEIRIPALKSTPARRQQTLRTCVPSPPAHDLVSDSATVERSTLSSTHAGSLLARRTRPLRFANATLRFVALVQIRVTAAHVKQHRTHEYMDHPSHGTRMQKILYMYSSTDNTPLTDLQAGEETKEIRLQRRRAYPLAKWQRQMRSAREESCRRWPPCV